MTENVNSSFNHGHLEHCAKDAEPMFGFNRIEFGNWLVTSTEGGRDTGWQGYSPPRARICQPCQGLASVTSSLGAGSAYNLNLSCKAQWDWFWRYGDDENPRLPVKLVLEISWVNWKDPWKKRYWSQRPKVSSQRKGQKRGVQDDLIFEHIQSPIGPIGRKLLRGRVWIMV